MTARRICFALLAAGLLLAGCGLFEKKDDPPDGGQDGGQQVSWEAAGFDAGSFGWLLSVAAAGPDAVWTVGGEPDAGAMKFYDGEGWSDVEIPDGVALLNWVHVFDRETVFVAANDGEVLRRKSGGGWEVQSTPTDQDLWGIWGDSPDDLWAVGGSGRQGGEATVIRNQGSGWEKVQVPDLQRSNVRAFFKVWGTSADNVYIVGQNGAVLHWDGQALQEELAGTGRDLISLWGTGPDNIVVVGGRGNGVVTHWDGSKWTATSLAPLPGVNGVWMQEPERAWIAMETGKVGSVDLSGSEPTVDSTQLDTQMSVHAVFGLESMGLYAVGGSLRSPRPPYRGLAYHRSDLQ